MRKGLVAAIMAFAISVTLGGLGVASAMTADLTLTVDGNSSVIRVGGGETVGAVLAAQGITVEPSDFVTPDESAVVTDGLEIQVAHARPFTATIDGQTRTVTTTASTVGGALASLGVDPATANLSLPAQTDLSHMQQGVTVTTWKMVSLKADGVTLYTQTPANDVAGLLAVRGIELGASDRVSPDLDTPLTDDMNVIVQRVSVVMTNQIGDVPFTTKKINDSSLAAGKTKVTTPGVVGSANQTWQVTMVDGTEESRKLVSQTIIKKPVTQVEHVGTKGAKPSTVPTPNVTPGSAQDIARQLLPSFGFGDDQLGCLVNLWDRESHWNVYAQNKNSGAYGIPQALPGSKMASAGSDWRTNPATQIKWGLGYIKSRYGSPCSAWSHFQKSGWY